MQNPLMSLSAIRNELLKTWIGGGLHVCRISIVAPDSPSTEDGFGLILVEVPTMTATTTTTLPSPHGSGDSGQDGGNRIN